MEHVYYSQVLNKIIIVEWIGSEFAPNNLIASARFTGIESIEELEVVSQELLVKLGDLWKLEFMDLE